MAPGQKPHPLPHSHSQYPVQPLPLHGCPLSQQQVLLHLCCGLSCRVCSGKGRVQYYKYLYQAMSQFLIILPCQIWCCPTNWQSLRVSQLQKLILILRRQSLYVPCWLDQVGGEEWNGLTCYQRQGVTWYWRFMVTLVQLHIC